MWDFGTLRSVSQIVEPGRPVTFEASVYNYADRADQ